MRSNRRSSMTSMTSSTLFIDRFPIENDRFTPDDLPFLSSFPLVDSNEGDSRSSNDFSVVHWIFSVWRGISCFCLPLQDLIELDAALNWDLPSFGGDLERDLLNHSGRKTAARSKLCARWVGTEVDRWHSVFFYRVFGNSFIRPHKMSGRHSLDFLHPIALVWQKKNSFLFLFNEIVSTSAGFMEDFISVLPWRMAILPWFNILNHVFRSILSDKRCWPRFIPVHAVKTDSMKVLPYFLCRLVLSDLEKIPEKILREIISNSSKVQ